MIGATAKSEQFHSRSGSESTKGSRKGFTLLGGGDDPLSHLTPEDRRASLTAIVRALQFDLSEAKASKEIHRVKQIGLRLFDLNTEINKIRPTRRSGYGNNIGNLFVDICREQMTKPQFNAIMTEANRRHRSASTKEKE